MSNNLMIDLKERKDQDGRVFYVGKLKAPANIDCREGVTFLVFISDVGEEQLQIAPYQDKDKEKDKLKPKEV
jgi:hypothetical protein